MPHLNGVVFNEKAFLNIFFFYKYFVFLPHTQANYAFYITTYQKLAQYLAYIL